MSVGFFMGIRPSYVDEAQNLAQLFIEAINHTLAQHHLPAYVEREAPDVYNYHLFGRSALDHESASLLAGLGKLAVQRQGAKQLALLAENPYRIAFVPIDFEKPLLTPYEEVLGGEAYPIAVGSSSRLFREVISLAALLGIPLERGVLSDSVASAINEYQPLFPGDAVDASSDQRTTWLLLHEGARLSLEHNIALSLAG